MKAADDIQALRGQAISDRDEAKRRLHWHLSRAAIAVASTEVGVYLGEWVDRELREVAQARADWDTAHERYWALQQGDLNNV